ncbi:MAG: D-2-hydroxyacid dehydrogenase [Anaerolineales bacterium]|nr:D-2-hydroxyacid dehydrogenase [Anaerolineales bacterium]
MPKLLLLTDNTTEYIDLLKQANLPDLEIFTEFNPECDIVFGGTGKIRKVFHDLPNLKWVQTMSAGVEWLMDPSLRRDYVLTNAKNVFGESMSEYVFGYMLYYKKRIAERQEAQHKKQWDEQDGGVLRGKTLGLIGVGSIGSHIAMTAKHFKMNVWGYTRGSETSTHVDRYFHPNNLESDSSLHSKGVLSFAKGLDYLIVVLPKTDGTTSIVNAEVLNALPHHALLINVGRGNAVDTSALLEALTQNKIAGAVLDVTEPEPLPEEHPFWTAPNLLLTFHTSAMSYPEDMVGLFVENYKLYIEGKPLKHQVDFERGY